jgi:hypothetical protein
MGVRVKHLKEIVISVCKCEARSSLYYLDHASICPAYRMLKDLWLEQHELKEEL